MVEISHDREFRKRKSADRRPARKPVKDVRADEGRLTQDFDLRRGRDAPVSGEDRRGYRQGQGRGYTEPAEDFAADYAALETGTGAGGTDHGTAVSRTEDAAYFQETGNGAGDPPADAAPVSTAARDFGLRRGRDAPASGEDRRRHRQDQSRKFAEQADGFTAGCDALEMEAGTSGTDHGAAASRTENTDTAHFPEDGSSLHGGSESPESRETAGGGTPFRQEPARAENRRDSRKQREKADHAKKQHGNKYQQRFRKEAEAEEQAAQAEGTAGGRTKKPSRLEFAADELPPEAKDKKLSRAGQKAERAEKKLEDAGARLPSRKKLRMETVSDPESGKAKKRLKFEKEVKSQRAHVKGPLPLRPVKAAANTAAGYAHKKIYQAEEENVGIKAAHRTEFMGEAGVRMAYHRHMTAPYRRVAKLQQKSASASARLAYRQTLHDNPELKKKFLARMWQKQKLKRQYAKAAREARKTGKRVKDAAVTTEKIAAWMVNTVKRHPVICGIIFLLLLVVFLISSLFSSFSNIGAGGLGSIAASTYLAEDADINNAELIYTEWETDLQMEIGCVETDRPGYDEYRYNIGAVEHDPYILMGYLTSVYQDFTCEQIEGVLRQLFNEQYALTFTEETEIRYRTETRVDPETGEETEEEVPYEWRILNVKLTATPLADLVVQRMSGEQKEICEILLQTKGNRQYVENVFGTNWLPYVTSYYGYRVHPVSGEKNYHTGVDIGMAQGTEILAGHDGTVTLAGNAGGYGLCVAIEGEAYGGHTLATKYGHCSQILVSAGQEVRAGDVIAKVGSTGNSTGPHLHLEVLVDGQYLNPLYFADTGDISERHLLAAGAGGGGNYFDYDVPPEALADEKFAAMLEEAEKYLGYPYVWGGASPSTSFDCSGYVSWVVNHCGAGWDFGRLTADGLLGVCTPVSSEDARPGDLIFFQGTYNTSGASHVGIYVGNGMMIHCGDPISYANINTSYWQSHFYTFGRLP